MRYWTMKLFLATAFFILSLVSFSPFKAQGNTPTPVLEAGTIVTDRNGFEMAYVPAGTVEMGIGKERLSDLIQQGVFGETAKSQSNILLGMAEEEGVFDTITVNLPAYWIDRYEITLEQYKAQTEYCIDTGLCETIDLSYAPELTADPHQPQVGVSWFDAIRFCIGREARLPTESEWEYAASGPENFIFPWGNTLIYDNLSSDNMTYPVGSRPNNKSWVGAYDMAGNAGEWVENLMKPYTNPPSANFFENRPDVDRVVRGGSYRTTAFHMTSFDRVGEYPDGELNGFRCLRSTDPTQ